MILYFTGTGNSRYIAARIADGTRHSQIRIHDRIKTGDTSPVLSDEDLILVVPTYAWRIPRLVHKWLRETEFPGAKRMWFVMNCGSEIGSAPAYNQKLCREMHLVYMGTAQIRMPENYIAMFDVPQAEEAEQIISCAQAEIDRVIQAVLAGNKLTPPAGRFYDPLLSGPINAVFYTVCVRSGAFTVKSACIGCGKCVQLCPLNNIALRDGRPVWGKTCTHCMACICQCPTEAIEYGKRSQGKPRYYCSMDR